MLEIRVDLMRWRRRPSRRARFVPSRESLYVLPLPHRPLITFALFVVRQVSAGIEELARQGEDLPRVPDYIIVLRPSRAARLSLRRLLLLLLPYATPPLRLRSRLAPRRLPSLRARSALYPPLGSSRRLWLRPRRFAVLRRVLPGDAKLQARPRPEPFLQDLP